MRTIAISRHGFLLCQRQILGADLEVATQHVRTFDQIPEFAKIPLKTYSYNLCSASGVIPPRERPVEASTC